MKKATGIVRRIDPLGRIVLPMELRRTMHIDNEDPIEIYVDGDDIILHKYAMSCVFCGSHEDIEQHLGQPVCPTCLEKLQKGRR